MNLPPGEPGKDSFCPARGVCCDGGGAETSGWRQRKGRDESTRDPWSPAGRERVKPTPWPACSLRPPRAVCALAQGASAVCPRWPFFALLPRAVGRPSVPQATSCAVLGSVSGAMGRENSRGWGCGASRRWGRALGLPWPHRGGPHLLGTHRCGLSNRGVGRHPGFAFPACEGRGRAPCWAQWRGTCWWPSP